MSAPLSQKRAINNNEADSSPPAPMDRSPNAVPDASSVRKDAITEAPKNGNYKGFVAGVFSGVTKLSVG